MVVGVVYVLLMLFCCCCVYVLLVFCMCCCWCDCYWCCFLNPCSCLRILRVLQKNGYLPNDASLFTDYARCAETDKKWLPDSHLLCLLAIVTHTLPLHPSGMGTLCQ